MSLNRGVKNCLILGVSWLHKLTMSLKRILLWIDIYISILPCLSKLRNVLAYLLLINIHFLAFYKKKVVRIWMRTPSKLATRSRSASAQPSSKPLMPPAELWFQQWPVADIERLHLSTCHLIVLPRISARCQRKQWRPNYLFTTSLMRCSHCALHYLEFYPRQRVLMAIGLRKLSWVKSRSSARENRV